MRILASGATSCNFIIVIEVTTVEVARTCITVFVFGVGVASGS